MGLATYTLKMAAVAAPAAAILAFGAEPIPTGWLDGIVDPGATVAHAGVVLGIWVAGATATAGGVIGFVCFSWQLWRERRRRAGLRDAS